ncbi:unnamed protein product [Sympodiomycopsis kandeliae]
MSQSYKYTPVAQDEGEKRAAPVLPLYDSHSFPSTTSQDSRSGEAGRSNNDTKRRVKVKVLKSPPLLECWVIYVFLALAILLVGGLGLAIYIGVTYEAPPELGSEANPFFVVTKSAEAAAAAADSTEQILTSAAVSPLVNGTFKSAAS